MRLGDLISETSFALLANKTRSLLTMLGIIIGIGSVISLVAVGEGTTATVTNNISALGSNLIVIVPGSAGGSVNQGIGSAQTLKLSDATALQNQLQSVTGVSPEISGHQQLIYKSKNINTAVVGANPVYATVHDTTVINGSFFNGQQNAVDSRVAVLGPNISQALFGSFTTGVGQTIQINNVLFTVIGIANPKGGNGISSPDNNVYVPLNTAQQYLFGQDHSLSNISISATNPSDINIVEAQATQIMLTQHNISKPAQNDFQIINQSAVVSSLSASTQILTILLGSIAGISLLVGGIGIMNMMLTTVTERTREIGIRKAVGAKQGDIAKQFLGEAVALTLIGGIIGILLGLLVTALLSKFHLVAVQVTGWSIILAFSVSMVVGVVFGYYPATRAAKLRPIDALRYE